MDYNMPPGINGEEAANQINSKIIFVTSDILKNKRYENIGKPVCKQRLREIIG